jgi:hypothetical protein
MDSLHLQGEQLTVQFSYSRPRRKGHLYHPQYSNTDKPSYNDKMLLPKMETWPSFISNSNISFNMPHKNIMVFLFWFDHTFL